MTLQRKNGTIIEVVVADQTRRAEWLLDPRLIIGKVVEVVAMKELEDGRLREPRLKDAKNPIREDKLPSEID